MQVSQFVRAAIPAASEALCEHILWARTPWPIGSTTPRDIYKAASRLRRAELSGIELCDFCDRRAVEHCLCAACAKALSQ